MVNGREAICLYDTGASGVAVKEYLVKPEMYTKKWVTCILADGRKARYPTANIDIVSKEFKGKTRAIVMKDLVKDLIVNPSLYKHKVDKVNTRNVGISVKLDEKPNAEFRSVGIDEVRNTLDHCSTLDECRLDNALTENAQQIAKPGVIVGAMSICTKEVAEVELAMCQTRSQARCDENSERNLKYPKLPKMYLSREEIIQLQETDETLNKY